MIAQNKLFTRPTILVSKCLEFDTCRYNALSINDSVVRSLKDYVEFLPPTIWDPTGKESFSNWSIKFRDYVEINDILLKKML